MADLTGFDAGNVQPSGGFEPIPAGKYVAVITDSDWKTNKAGTGRYLELTFQVTEGDYQNRLLWARLNLEHPKAIAVQIANADLSAICRAVNVLKPKDSSELHNLPLVIHVRVKKRDDNGELINEAKGYSKRDTAALEKPIPSSDDTPPWMRP